MKSIVSFSFVILAIFNCLLLASASPAPSAASTAETPEESAIRVAVAWMKANPTKLNPSCFYSGYTMTTSGQRVEAQNILHTEWIGKSGGAPYNCRLIGEVVDDSGARSEDIKDWSTVSETFAQLVSGKVYVLLGKMVSADSIWVRKESPALNLNTKVTKPLERWEIGTDGKPVKLV
ncbi:hypothetical protein C0991_010568 [Blastosporella zonata]|nr:hypothetical protein C0991_010568 [Blastosporella zonata]